MSDKVLVCGSIAYDTIMNFSDRFRNHILPDKIHVLNVAFTADRLARHFGGTGGNIAWTLHLLGGDPLLFGVVGKDFDAYRSWLEVSQIDHSHIRIEDDLFCAAAHIITDLDDNQITAFHPGAMALNGVPARELIEAQRPVLAIVSPDGRDGMLLRPAELRETDVPFFFDPGQMIPAFSGEELLGMAEGAQALLANDYELQLILDKTGKTEAQLLELVPTIICTLGPKGSRLLRRGAEPVDIGVVASEEVVDPTGAGDAFRGGLLRGRVAGLDWPAAMRLGACAAVYAVERVGTQNHRFTMEEYRERYREAFGENCPL